MCKVVAAIVDALFLLMMMCDDVCDTSRNKAKENENSLVLSLVLGFRFVRLNIGNDRMIAHSSYV
jgi:hypothetical protein